MTHTKSAIFLASLALFGAGCQLPIAVPSSGEIAEKPVPAKPAICAQTPQVYYFNKLAFSAAEVSSIESNVVERMKAHYRTRPGYELVSVFVRRNATGIVVDAIIDQPESNDPVYEGFVLNRLKDGTYPAYEPVDAGPGYEG